MSSNKSTEVKRRPGRPSLEEDKKRNCGYRILLTKEEFSQLKDMAKKRNVTIAKLIRTSIFENN